MPSNGLNKKWWKEAVVYQIYPSSFVDSNNNGWGDLPGIISKLDYLKELGVDIVWLSPIYKSPMKDMGYDISDCTICYEQVRICTNILADEDIDPRYGTLADADALIGGLKERNMKLMMDLVVNHTSTEHAWFLESKSSRNNPKRDWYIWKPAQTDKSGQSRPPNNWSQILGDQNSAWTWDEQTQEYYLSLFTPDQPDLNWENPEVRAAVHDVLRFWLDKGVSGFRMDVINLISKVPGFPDADIVDPKQKYQPGIKYYANGPRLHEFLQNMNREVLSKYDTITVGEMPFVRDPEEILKIVSPERRELNMIFIFDIVDIDNAPGGSRLTLHDWDASDIRNIMSKWQRLMLDGDGWNSVFCENHDNPRSVSRYCDGSDEHRDHGAKLLALMLSTLAGTLYVFQGQEIGQRNVPPSWKVEEYKDIESINYYKKMIETYPDDEEKRKYALHVLQRKARDHARTPVQWTPEKPNAGFCGADTTPWMRVNDDYPTVNVEVQKNGADASAEDLSVWQYWQRALQQRKKHTDVFVYGDFQLVGDTEHSKVFAYVRSSDKEAFLVVLNFSGQSVEWEIPGDVEVVNWAAGNYTAGSPDQPTSGKVVLNAWEGLLAVVKI